MRSDRHISKGSRRCAILRAVMILSMWQAPIPFLHCHSLRAEDASGDATMRQHLVRFHRDALRHPGLRLGWHVHFDLPAEFFGFPDDDAGSPTKSRNDSARFERATVAETRLELTYPASPELERLAPCGSPTDVRAAHGEERPRVGNFLTTFVDSTSINLLVCVARC